MNTLIRIVKSPLQPDRKQQWDVHFTSEGADGERCLPFEFDQTWTEDQCRTRAAELFVIMQPPNPE